MSEYLASRIDLYHLGAATVSCTCASGSADITLSQSTASRYYHGDATDDTDDGTAPAQGGTDCLGPAFKVAFDASALTETITVTFDPATGFYTFTPSSGTLAMSFSGTAGTLMRHLLGMTGNRGAAASLTSQICPWYWLILPDKTKPSPRNVISGAYLGSETIGSSGLVYGVGPATLPRGRSWIEQRVPKATALNQYGGADAWTLERFYDYHRTHRRWLHFPPGTTTFSYANREAVYQLTGAGRDDFKMAFDVPHWVDYLNVPFDVVEHTAGASS